MNNNKTVFNEPATKNQPNFKDLCKKFETLSGNNEFKKNINTPFVPAPRTKSVKKDDQVHFATPVLKSTSGIYRTHPVSTPKRPISVRERSKIFELSDRRNSESDSVDSVNIEQSDSSSTNHRNDNLPAHPTPPLKPPRSFTTTKIANIQRSKNVNIRKSSSPEIRGIDSVTSSSTRETPTIKDDQKRSKNVAILNIRKNSFPEIRNIDSVSSSFATTVKDVEKVKVPETPTNGDLSPKVKVSGKTQGLRGYLKSTANNLKEKVRHAKIFVDLTPTTVSPPKHYATLKRSKSEEHIYAEPYINGVVSVKQEQIKVVEPLHYMCTPLIKPELPERRNGTGACDRLSVRNMIYSSFAPLRSVPNENQINKAPSLDSSDSDVSMKAIEARIIYVKSIRQVSGSSICIAPKLYEALFIINITENQPEISHSFPLKVPDAYKYPLLPHICFPDVQLFKAASVYQSETFHFTLYDRGEKVLGYCLRIMGWPENSLGHQPLCVKLPTAICILSRFKAPLFYKKLLNEIEKHLTLPREKCFKYIRSLQKLGVPNAGASVSIPDFTECSEDDRVVVSRPLDSHIVGSEITRTLQLLDVSVLVKSVASMLLERRLLLISSSPSNLYHSCKALSSLLYPFDWPHMFIPVLPSCLTVHCCSELPYVLGLLSNNYNSVLELLAEHEVLVIDVDKGTIVKSYNDEDTILPRKIQKALITALNLAKNMTDPTEMLRDMMISEAFVHMFVEIVGHYENHIQEQNENFIFQKEAFLKNSFTYSIQIFLQWFSETQMFDAFISESLWRAKYRKICQTTQRTFFEKRVDEYKWELSHDGEKFSRFIGKTFKNFENLGEMIIHKLKK